MSDDKCKGCQWHNKPYWSIINPCDNCPRENTNVEIITRWQDPTIEELKSQLQQKENIIKEVREYIESYNLEYLHEINEHNLADILEELLDILDKEVS